MSLRNTVNYDLWTLNAANEYTPMIFIKDFTHVSMTVIAANSANATVKFYISDSEARPSLAAVASAINIYSPVEVINVDTGAVVDGSTWISRAGATDGITKHDINVSAGVWVWAIMTARSAGDVTFSLAAFSND